MASSNSEAESPLSVAQVAVPISGSSPPVLVVRELVRPMCAIVNMTFVESRQVTWSGQDSQHLLHYWPIMMRRSWELAIVRSEQSCVALHPPSLTSPPDLYSSLLSTHDRCDKTQPA